MVGIQVISIDPRYIRDDELVVTGIDRPELMGIFAVRDMTYVGIPPGIEGGNHKHPRMEAFIGLGAGLVLYWLDEWGMQQVIELDPTKIVVVDALTPHVVKNTAAHSVYLIEYADGPQRDVERVEVVE